MDTLPDTSIEHPHSVALFAAITVMSSSPGASTPFHILIFNELWESRRIDLLLGSLTLNPDLLCDKTFLTEPLS